MPTISAKGELHWNVLVGKGLNISKLNGFCGKGYGLM
jgi:hypothetical protein